MSSSAIHQFDVFAQLVASGSIISSARALNMPVSDILSTMDILEERVGYRLFQIDDENFSLTPTGQKLVHALARLSFAEQEQWINAMLGDADTAETPRNAPSPVVPNNDDDTLLLTTALPDANHAPSSINEIEDSVSRMDDGTAPQSPSHASHSPAGNDNDNDSEDEEAFTTFQRPRPPARTITIASHPAIFSHFQDALLAFEQASPDVDIALRLEPLTARDIERLFQRKLADLAYFHALDDKDTSGSRYAWSERISLFVGDGHPLASTQTAMADDLAAFPYVALSHGNPARLLSEQALASNGLIVGPALLETDNLYDIMQQVQQRPCYFAAFGPMARDFGKMPGITRIAYAQGLPQVHVRQAVREDLADDPILLALSEFLFR